MGIIIPFVGWNMKEASQATKHFIILSTYPIRNCVGLALLTSGCANVCVYLEMHMRCAAACPWS